MKKKVKSYFLTYLNLKQRNYTTSKKKKNPSKDNDFFPKANTLLTLIKEKGFLSVNHSIPSRPQKR